MYDFPSSYSRFVGQCPMDIQLIGGCSKPVPADDEYIWIHVFYRHGNLYPSSEMERPRAHAEAYSVLPRRASRKPNIWRLALAMTSRIQPPCCENIRYPRISTIQIHYTGRKNIFGGLDNVFCRHIQQTSSLVRGHRIIRLEAKQNVVICHFQPLMICRTHRIGTSFLCLFQMTSSIQLNPPTKRASHLILV